MYETMKVALPPEQMKWLEAEVSAGRFNSVDDAMAAAVAALMSARDDDLAWAKPYVEQARASVERGDVISGQEFFERLESKLSSLHSS
jgi:antitoxin ParD1/3/4